MIANLLTEQPNPASERIDRMSTRDILRVMNDLDREVAEAVTSAIPRVTEAVDAIVDAIEAVRRHQRSSWPGRRGRALPRRCLYQMRQSARRHGSDSLTLVVQRKMRASARGPVHLAARLGVLGVPSASRASGLWGPTRSRSR